MEDTEMVENTFGFLDFPIRDGKPRKSGLSMVHDPGLSPSQFEAIIEPMEPFLDYMKFRSLNPRLYPETQYFKKLRSAIETISK
jgi:phosphosulfolactate synthase (CoM biosynthesis protein A)